MSKARFIEPMLLLRTDKLPDGPQWLHELKFDGYRAVAIKSGGKVHLRSRNDKDFNSRYPAIVKALAAMPDDTVIDGEVVALGPGGKPSFNLLQNSAAGADLHYFIFDVLILKGQDVMGEPLVKRRELLEKHIFPKLDESVRYSPILEASLEDLIHSVKAQGLESARSRTFRDARETRDLPKSWAKWIRDVLMSKLMLVTARSGGAKETASDAQRTSSVAIETLQQHPSLGPMRAQEQTDIRFGPLNRLSNTRHQ